MNDVQGRTNPAVAGRQGAGNVELLVNGKIYSGWKSVSVRRSLDLFASSFDLTLTDNQAGEARTIKLGSACKVRINGETLITGYVDRIRPRYEAKSRGLTVSGRSRVADLVDCSLPAHKLGGSQLNNRTLLQMASTVCGLLGLSARSTVTDLERRAIVNIESGQMFYEFLESQSRVDGVLLVDDQDGNLVITRASKERVGTALVLGENIEAAEGEFSERDRYSHYYIDAQRPATSLDTTEDIAHITGKAEDINVRYRPTSVHLVNANFAQARRHAQWQRNVQYGRSRQATYTVSGWHHKDGLWQPNTNVLVQDEWMGFTGKDGCGEWLMIGTVELVQDSKGKRARLTVMPKEAYDLIPLPADDGGEW